MDYMYEPERWHEAYAIIGTGAADLSGLIIVAASVRADRIMATPHWRLLARNTTIGMICVMIASILVLMPQNVVALGYELLVFNTVCTLALPVHVLTHVRRRHANLPLLPPIIAVAVFVVAGLGGLSLVLGRGGGLYLTTFAYLVYLPHGVLNAYRLLVPLDN